MLLTRVRRDCSEGINTLLRKLFARQFLQVLGNGIVYINASEVVHESGYFTLPYDLCVNKPLKL
jgi:hypothetical protein